LAPVVEFADLADLDAETGAIALVTDADPAAMLVVFDGSDWIDVNTGVEVTDGV
jgi:hypothetical protein